MTRSYKFNDKDHQGLAEGTVAPHDHHLPKFFSKHGFKGVNPTKTKKSGAGKGNWGNPRDDVPEDEVNYSHARRHSNSDILSDYLEAFKTKFEVNEPEPVFEEKVHGPTAEEDDNALTKIETSSSETSSVDTPHRNSV